MLSTPLTRMKYAILPEENTLVIQFSYHGNNWRAIYALELLIENMLIHKKVGRYDRERFSRVGTSVTFHMHGSDTHMMLKTIQPLLGSCRFVGGYQAHILEHRRHLPALKKSIPIASGGGK